MQWEPLGDQAVLVRLPDEESALRFGAALRAAALPEVIDVVQSFRTVAAFFDPLRTDAEAVAAAVAAVRPLDGPLPGREHVVPCCYELGPDLAEVAAACRLSPERVIALHTATVFTVYAVGFCPGFPYLGWLPAELSGVPRRAEPRVRVPAGSVGITVRFCGIYTLPRPGGWHLIGRTPLVMADPAADHFPLRPGDRVRFRRIDEGEYNRLAVVKSPPA
jgi:inhibitor of KinA